MRQYVITVNKQGTCLATNPSSVLSSRRRISRVLCSGSYIFRRFPLLLSTNDNLFLLLLSHTFRRLLLRNLQYYVVVSHQGCV